MNNYYGEIEIIENVKVRKLQRRKVITVNISGPLGVNVQLIPKLGIGVNTVNSTSAVYDKIHRGEIICEFNGQKLHDINHVKDFVEMAKQCDGDERQFVIEYVATSLGTMWKDTAQTAKGMELVYIQLLSLFCYCKQYNNLCFFLKFALRQSTLLFLFDLLLKKKMNMNLQLQLVIIIKNQI